MKNIMCALELMTRVSFIHQKFYSFSVDVGKNNLNHTYIGVIYSSTITMKGYFLKENAY